MIRHLVLTFALLYFVGVPSAYAAGIQFSVTPQNPAPGERVVITATAIGSPSRDLFFEWEVDGELVAQGAGENVLNVEAPVAGELLTVAVAASANGVEVASGSMNVRPAEVTIEWEGNTETTPWYTGRPLVTAQSTFVATAIPSLIRTDGTRVAGADTMFVWTVNGVTQTKTSGYGRSTISFSPPFFNDSFRVGVTVSARDGLLTAEDTVIIRPTAPQIVVYEESPLGGVLFDHAIVGTLPFTGEEVSVIAYPLFVTNPSDLNYEWTLNGSAFVLDTTDPRRAVFKKTGTGGGTYTVGLSFKHATRFLERARQSFLLSF